MEIISVRENPQITNQAIAYFQKSWSSVWPIIYEDCLNHAIHSENPLPQWYVLLKDEEIIGGVGLITNDFISRMDLYPWLCALHIDKKFRGNNLAKLLIGKVIDETKKLGFSQLNLCTDHIGYYEKFGFKYIGQGYHPWQEKSRIYQMKF